ncbi:MAG: hypothetical protein ACI9OU_000610 [Candidatus Promineifilaceae bacterium]|jgi:hypothetical protein
MQVHSRAVSVSMTSIMRRRFLSMKFVSLCCVFSLWHVGLMADPTVSNFFSEISVLSRELLAIDWVLPQGGDGVALTRSVHLDDWAFAGSPDDWPTGGSNAVVSIGGDEQGAFRLEASCRGQVRDLVFQQQLSRFLIGILLANAGITGITPAYDVAIYRVTYDTFDHRRISTRASGALCIPLGLSTAPVISLQHGTIYERLDAPSVALSLEQSLGIAVASEGYIAVQPDYLGLGTNSPGLHPYVHARSSAVASIDMLRASLSVVATVPGANTNGNLFLAGYSQGGHTTLAMLREIEAHHSAEFNVTACAPMAGPHDLSGVMHDVMLSNANYASPAYLPYTLLGLNQVYGIFASPDEVLAPPYDTTIPPLFDGATPSSTINAALPSVPRQIIATNFLADFESNTNNVVWAVLRANDTWRGWVPQVPVRFIHCAADGTVPVANSHVAMSNLVAAGATRISFFDPSPASGHGDCALPAFLSAKSWFDSLNTP